MLPLPQLVSSLVSHEVRPVVGGPSAGLVIALAPHPVHGTLACSALVLPLLLVPPLPPRPSEHFARIDRMFSQPSYSETLRFRASAESKDGGCRPEDAGALHRRGP